MHHTGEPHPIMTMLLALSPSMYWHCMLAVSQEWATMWVCCVIIASPQFLCHINLGINDQSDGLAILQTAVHPCSKPTTGPLPRRVVGHKISTPLKVEEWQQAISTHPDWEWVSSLVQGSRMDSGLASFQQPPCRLSGRKCPSALEHSQVISEFLL